MENILENQDRKIYSVILLFVLKINYLHMFVLKNERLPFFIFHISLFKKIFYNRHLLLFVIQNPSF